MRAWIPKFSVLVGASIAAACGARPELSPAPGAQPAPAGPGRGAMATTAGVTVIARTDAWSGVPRRLDDVTPVLVTIENEGDSPIRLRYDRFALLAPTGERYAAIPPFDVRGTEVEPLSQYDLDGFYVAPHLARYYPWLRPYRGYFPYDGLYYDTYYPQFLRIRLPTGDMIQKALPEGVLSPGGRITGFLYFENPDGDTPRVNFTFEMVDAESERTVGVVAIPFIVD